MTVLKEELCYTHRFLETGGRDPVQDHTGKHWNQSRVRGREGDMWARAFTVGFVGKNGPGRVSRFRIGWFE